MGRVAFALFFALLLLLNSRLYGPLDPDLTTAQLRHLATALERGGAERMQALFPEGFVFTWALFGLASVQVAERLSPSDPHRDELLADAHHAVRRVLSPQARSTFDAALDPPYGAFYASWSLYLRSAILRAEQRTGQKREKGAEFEADCDAFAAALERNPSPFLPSYRSAAWPGDTAVGVAALAVRDSILEPRHRGVVESWVRRVRTRMDTTTGAIPHAADAVSGMPRGSARGESLALMARILVDVDPALARDQYEVLRDCFSDYRWGIPGVREFPPGVDAEGDIDSGPLVLGFSAPAITVGAAAALANGDPNLADALLATAEVAGFPVQFGGQRWYAGGLLPVGDAFLAWARSTPAAPPAIDSDPHRVPPASWKLRLHAISLMLLAGVFLVGRGRCRDASQPLAATDP
jgi:hypothetical protein